MVDLTGTTRRWTQRLLGARGRAEIGHAGAPATADGLTALALIEAALCDAVVMGAEHPAMAVRRRFFEIAQEGGLNLWGRPVERIEASGAREALARASGLALAGSRVAVFLTQEELRSAADLLAEAAARRLPLIVHAVGTSGPSRMGAGGTGEDGLSAAASTGVPVRVAATVQEAADLAVALRRAAEDALVPMVLAVDGESTALSVQDFLLVEDSFLRDFIGDAGATRHADIPSQEMLLGRHRARVPRWHDPERPLLGGALGGSREAAWAAAGAYAFHDVHVIPSLQGGLEAFAKETGRGRPAVTSYHVDGAKTVLVAAAGSLEFLEAAVDRARELRKQKAGVIALHSLWPFPAEPLVELLRGKEAAIVLEGSLPRTGSGAPLYREVAALAAGQLDAKSRPRLVSAPVPGGLASLRAGDLDALFTAVEDPARTTILVGVSFDRRKSPHPKREVLLSSLRRYYPGAERLGAAALPGAMVDPPRDTLTAVIMRSAGRGGDDLVPEAAEILTRLAGGHVRTRSVRLWERWGAVAADRLVHSRHAVLDAGPDARADIVLWTGAGYEPPHDLTRPVRDGGILVAPHPSGSKGIKEAFAPSLLKDIANRRIKLYLARPGDVTEAEPREERLLGAFFGVLQKESKLESSARKITTARGEMLGGLSEADREARLGHFRAGFDAILAVETSGFAAAAEEAPAEPEVPVAVRRLKRTDEAIDSLSRFWDQVGILYRSGETGEITPDPYLAMGMMPPLTAAFGDSYGESSGGPSARAATIPEFDASKCTGCSDCWSICPDGAIEPLAITPAALLESGMALAKESGKSADGLRMVASKLHAAMTDTVLVSATRPSTAAEVLDDAFARLLKRTTVSEERKIALGEAMNAVRDAVGKLPTARTDLFFDHPEKDSKGAGALVAIAINPDACKACGLCAAVCEPHALTLASRDRMRVRRSRTVFKVVESLPGTSEEILSRASAQPRVGRVGAALLDRDARQTFGGSDGSEAGSGEKIALRQALAVAQRERRVVKKELGDWVAGLKDRLSAEIREGMARALPVGDLDALSQGLAAMQRPDVDLGELSQRIETAFDSGRVDVVRMRRLVEAAKAVTDLHWRLEEGGGGLGQAPFSLVLGPGTPAGWAAVFPRNPFAVPVTVAAGGETAALARGILEGELRRAARDAALLRQARLELDDPKEASRAAERPTPVGIRDLDAAERRFVPPLFVVLSESSAGREWAGLYGLLAAGFPVRVLVLSESPIGVHDGMRPTHPADPAGEAFPDLALAAGADGRVFAAQTSFSNQEHLGETMVRALAFDGPGLVVLHAPSPERHGFPTEATLMRARDAVASRTFPLYRLDPVRGSGAGPPQAAVRLSLEGNPEPGHPWTSEDSAAAVTPAHWALGEARYSREFEPVDEEKGEPVPVAAFLDLPAEERKEKIPFATDPGGTRRAVGPDLLRGVEGRFDIWSLLRTLASGPEAPAAGETPETSAPDEAPAAAAAQIEEALAGVRADYEERMAGLRLDMARQVRGRLLALVTRRAANGGGKEEDA